MSVKTIMKKLKKAAWKQDWQTHAGKQRLVPGSLSKGHSAWSSTGLNSFLEYGHPSAFWVLLYQGFKVLYKYMNQKKSTFKDLIG